MCIEQHITCMEEAALPVHYKTFSDMTLWDSHKLNVTKVKVAKIYHQYSPQKMKQNVKNIITSLSISHFQYFIFLMDCDESPLS